LDLTQSAAAAIRRLIADARDPNIVGVRIAASGGGCAGLSYDMGLEAATRQGDAVIRFNDVAVIVDEQSQLLLAGAEVDFNEIPVAGFVFNNPNVCGRSDCGGKPGDGARC